MKHVFYIHSHITFLVATSVVKQLGLKKTDICFLTGRNYQPYPTYENYYLESLTIEQNEIDKVPSYGSNLLMIKKGKTLRSIDQLLIKVTCGKPFIAYLPSTRNFLMQFISTHHNCEEIRLIEEGTMTYKPDIVKAANPAYKTFWGKIRRSLKAADHGFRSNYYQSSSPVKPIELYGFSHVLETALKGSCINVTLVKLNTEYIGSRDWGHQPDDSLFLMDGLIENKIATVQQVQRSFSKFLQNMDKRNRIHIKFHPIQKSEDVILEVFQKYQFPVSVIDNSTPLEILLLESKRMKVYGCYSSLLFYGALFGHEVRSIYPFIEEGNPIARTWRENAMPPIFSMYVKPFDFNEIS